MATKPRWRLMSEARWLTGDVFEHLSGIPDGSVDLVCTSPPFWRQRAYLPADHPLKPFEIGQEASPGDFIDVMLRLSVEFRRVLAPHGSIAVELGDTMAGSGGAGGDYNDGGLRAGQPKWDGAVKGRGWTNLNHGVKRRGGAVDAVLAKSHCCIPEAYRIGLAYGHNPLTGAPSPAGRWIVRNVVDWCRPNPTPGDDGDKFRRATSDIVCATLSPKRWWDSEAVREPASYPDDERHTRPDKKLNGKPGDHDGYRNSPITGTRPLYDWWNLASDPYSGSHYAVWNPEVARRLILAMCPQRVCVVCGEPSRRIVERAEPPDRDRQRERRNEAAKNGNGLNYPSGLPAGRVISETWSECGHNQWRPGHVLDPFGGSGTTASVATGNGRDCTSIDLDDRNLDLARDRIGMFLTEQP